MARKRDRSKRKDYRKGGRVTLAKGGKSPTKGKKKKTVVKKAPPPKVKATKPKPVYKPRPKPKPVSKPKPRPKPPVMPQPPEQGGREDITLASGFGGIGKGGVRQSPEERERMKTLQAQPIPEGFIRNLSTGELLPKQPAPRATALGKNLAADMQRTLGSKPVSKSQPKPVLKPYDREPPAYIPDTKPQPPAPPPPAPTPAVPTPAVPTPTPAPTYAPATTPSPPRRETPFDPADRDMQESASIAPPLYSSFPKVTGTTKGRPSTTTTVTERVKSTGGMEDTYDTYPIRPPTAGTVTEVKRTDTGLNLDPADIALLNTNQTDAQRESITNKLGSLYSETVAAGKKVTVFDVLKVGVEALVDPLSLIWKGTTKAFDLESDVIGPLFDKAEADGLPVTAGDMKALVDIIDTQIKVGNKSFNFQTGGTSLTRDDIAKAVAATLIEKGKVAVDGIAMKDIVSGKVTAGKSGTVLATMPTKFSGVGPGTQFDKEGAGDDPPVDPDAPVGSLGVAGDKAAAAAAVGYSVGSGMGARGDAWRSEDGGDYEDMTYGTNPDNVPQDPNAARKWENKRRELEGLDTDVDGNPLPLGTKHYDAAQRAMSNLGRQPNAEETQNWLYETYPEAYKASLRDQGIDTTDFVYERHDPVTNPMPTQDPIVDDDTGDDDGAGDDSSTGASGDNLSRQRAIDITAGLEGSEGPLIGAPKNVGYQRDEKGELILDPDGNPIPAGITSDEDIQTIPSPLPSGYSFNPPEAEGDYNYPTVMPSEGMRYAYGPNGNRIEVPIDTAAPLTAAGITDPTLMTTEDATVTSALQQGALTAKGYEADQVGTDTKIIGETGDIGDDSLAKAAKVDRIAPIQAATVDIPEGALTKRVVGTLSPNAIAIAAKAAGTTLSKVTRAKKQLRNSGMSEEAIAALGNDPEDLEDRLMDLTEAERGVIGDLPEEALVSNQIDSLLKGMENDEIPTWASPAVAAVEQMLAQRGLSASTVGRDNLFNAIIQSAIPIAQSNAQAIQQSVAQSRDIESREDLANAQMRQQTALQNASSVFQMDMAQFSADQQTALSNSKYMQTVSLTEASNRQQAAIQDATILAQMNLADADFYQKHQIQNAQAFLGMDMANLSNKQQGTILSAQINQQSMLSNQSATNVSRQFNATSENQTQQFMAGLAQQIEITNAAAATSVSQFNAQQENAKEATRFQVEADLNKAKAAMANEINKFNTQIDFNRNQWNKQNAQVVEQSNISWRRQANTINTAAANQISMQNAMNAFNLNGQALSFLWQELRDQASFNFQKYENSENRKAELYAQAIANEAQSASDWESNINSVGVLIKSMFG